MEFGANEALHEPGISAHETLGEMHHEGTYDFFVKTESGGNESNKERNREDKRDVEQSKVSATELSGGVKPFEFNSNSAGLAPDQTDGRGFEFTHTRVD